jgi:hypothetical protein
MHTVSRTVVTWRVALGGFLLLTWGLGTGLVVGLCIVHVLGWLGLDVETGTGTLLRRAFFP